MNCFSCCEMHLVLYCRWKNPRSTYPDKNGCEITRSLMAINIMIFVEISSVLRTFWYQKQSPLSWYNNINYLVVDVRIKQNMIHHPWWRAHHAHRLQHAWGQENDVKVYQSSFSVSLLEILKHRVSFACFGAWTPSLFNILLTYEHCIRYLFAICHWEVCCKELAVFTKLSRWF